MEHKYEIGQRVYVINDYYEGYGTIVDQRQTRSTHTILGYLVAVDDPNKCTSDIDTYNRTRVYAAESHVTLAHSRGAMVKPEQLVNEQEEEHYREIL